MHEMSKPILGEIEKYHFVSCLNSGMKINLGVSIYLAKV